ncbi:MAG TPA: hypothetical protein PLY93_09450 [Turneriella sp.]|nr:hypothetical protein [Turneriella sp.]
MAKGARGSKNNGADGQHLITILFVLGVIGWGFFAIDRLTDPEETSRIGVNSASARGHSVDNSSWRKNLRAWLSKKLSVEKQTVVSKPQRVSLNIPLEQEPQNLTREDLEETLTQVDIKEEPLAEKPSQNEVSVLFYRLDKKGQPTLSMVKRAIDAEKRSLRSMLTLLIKGPTLNEQDRDYIDSFIRKPRVLSAGVHRECVYIDFDKNFGSGVSYQTMRFQIQQLFTNATVWTKTSCLELRVQGKYTPHLGSDGLFFPKRIDAVWLKENL